MRGVAVFRAELDDLFLPLPLPWPVDDEARIAKQLYLAPLVRLVGRGDGALVAYVGRERGDVYRLRAGQLIALADETAECPAATTRAAGRRRGTSGTSRRSSTGTCATSPTRSTAACAGCGTSASCSPAPEETRAELREALSRPRRGRRSSAGLRQRLTSTRRGCSRRRARCSTSGGRGREEELLDALARGGGAGTAVPRPAGKRRCRPRPTVASSFCSCRTAPTGRRLSALPAAARRPRTGSCPLDGTTLQAADTGLDLAVHQTLTHGGTVEVIGEEHRDLEPVGGLAALLRF